MPAREQDLYDNADAKVRYEAYRCEFTRYEAYRWASRNLPCWRVTEPGAPVPVKHVVVMMHQAYWCSPQTAVYA